MPFLHYVLEVLKHFFLVNKIQQRFQNFCKKLFNLTGPTHVHAYRAGLEYLLSKKKPFREMFLP